MKKVEFIKELKNRLSKLPDYELNRTVSFYTESIDDRIEEGMNEEQAVESLGSLDKIISETLIDTPLTSLIQKKIKQSRKTSGNHVLWTVLAICGFPFWLPLAIALMSVIFSIYISIWAVVISLFAAELSLAITGLFGLVTGLVLSIRTDFIVGLSIIGISLVSAGLFIMTVKPLVWLCRQFIALTGVLLRKVKSIFVSDKEEIECKN